MLYLVGLFIFITEICAEDHIAFALKQAEQLQEEANKLIAGGEVTDKLFTPHKCQKYTPQKSCSASKFTSKTLVPGHSKILLFVSLSISEASLKSLAQEAQKHNAVLLMRGLHEDSFAKTAVKLKDLDLSVEIHPELFEKYQITSVPTFIEFKDNEPVERLSGNVSLSFCRSKFGEQS